VEDFIDLVTTVSKKSYHHLRLSPMRPNELWTCPDDGAARAPVPDCQRSSCGSVRRGRGGDRYTIFGKHCKCIVQKCKHLERLSHLASHLLLRSHCVLTQHGGPKKKVVDMCIPQESNKGRVGIQLMCRPTVLFRTVVPNGSY